METQIVICALGGDRPGLVDQFSRAVRDSGCTIGESRMAVLGSEFGMVVLVAGNWNSVAKLESILPRIGVELGMEFQTKRTSTRTGTGKLVPYAIEVVAVDQPGIVHDVASFFALRGINVEDLYTVPYPAPHTGAAMFALHMTVGIPADSAIATVRGEFMEFCDEINLDVMMAPVK